jgi:hypothetical protein
VSAILMKKKHLVVLQLSQLHVQENESFAAEIAFGKY